MRWDARGMRCLSGFMGLIRCEGLEFPTHARWSCHERGTRVVVVGLRRAVALSRDAHVSDDEAIANMGRPDCAATGEERESARSRSVRCAQDDNSKGSGQVSIQGR